MTLSVKSSAGQAQWRPFREFENLYAEMGSAGAVGVRWPHR